MNDNKTICLRCSCFRLEDERGGVCRVDRHLAPSYPHKSSEDTCDRWRDCGQQYFIRLGWLKRRRAELLNENGTEPGCSGA